MHQSPAMTRGTCPFVGDPHGQRPRRASSGPTCAENASNPAAVGFLRYFVHAALALSGRARAPARLPSQPCEFYPICGHGATLTCSLPLAAAMRRFSDSPSDLWRTLRQICPPEAPAAAPPRSPRSSPTPACANGLTGMLARHRGVIREATGCQFIYLRCIAAYHRLVRKSFSDVRPDICVRTLTKPTRVDGYGNQWQILLAQRSSFESRTPGDRLLI